MVDKINLEDLIPISEGDAINEILLYGSTICLMRLQGGSLYFSIKDFTDFFDTLGGGNYAKTNPKKKN